MADSLAITNRDPTVPAFFRHRLVDGHYLITNQTGQYHFLTPDELKAFVDGDLDADSELYRTLAEKGFVRAQVRVGDLASQLDLRKSFLSYGPLLHVVEVTLRCNQTCVYCHSSRAGMEEVSKDMSKETAEKVVDLIFQTTSPSLTIEFQGGEPLVNFDVVKHIIEYALKKNETIGKTLEFSLVTNLSLMDDDKLAFLLENKTQICTSIDGPPELHNKQRKEKGKEAFTEAKAWVHKINQAYIDAGLNPEVYHVEGLLTTTRESLQHARAIVDTYIDLGFRALFLRPVDPFGFAHKTRQSVGFSPEEYLAFYRQVLDYIIEKNLDGEQILERYAAIFLTKILTGEDPNFLDLRSPCGAGIGQVAYSYDGKLFICDEARMLANMGDDFFQIGHVGETTYREAMTHETVRSLTIASNLDTSPDCTQCVYNPYCGICPVFNYMTQGSLHGQMRTSRWCAMLMGIQDYLFTKLRQNDAKLLEVFNRWVTVRPRDHYLHMGGAR